ncbi:MAG: hypothetical protein GY811_12750 [Myxococcales bacterium]|nr:hypothetical protein [Myxococcales bacterium]
MPYRGRCLATLCAVLLGLCAPTEANAEDASEDDSGSISKLGSYERGALRYALEIRGLTLEAKPEGKLLGKIIVVNLDVFGREEGILSLLNFLHATTREHVIEREVLLRPGELWDAGRVAETQRDLKDPLFTSIVVVMPVESENADRIDLLVVTRDTWSLRLNSAFEYLQGNLIGLQLSVAENNIFGLRKHGAFVFYMNQGSYTLGPQYIDKALGGTRLQLTTRFNTIFSRETDEFEGTSSGTSLFYPLWSLRQKWGGDIKMTHANFVSRSFLGSAIETVDLENTPEVEALPRIFEARRLEVTSRVRRSFGRDTKRTLTFGHNLSVYRPSFLDDFEATQAQREAFAAQVFPRSERVSAIFVHHKLFTPNYVVYRNLSSFDLAEDVRLGPEINVGVSLSLKPIGSETTFYQPNASAAYVLDIGGDGYFRGAIEASSRLESGDFIDNFSRTSLKLATPRIAGAFRIVGKADLGIRFRERGNGRFVLGGDNGLRGYLIREFSGQKQFLSNLEIRSMPLRILFARAGALLFWDMGHTADRMEELNMKHSVGFGLRALLPQLQPIVFRFDWAFPLDEESAGYPGRISAGVAQVF